MPNVPFLNCFEVPADQEAAFLELWGAVNAYMVRKPGYVSHRLHRSLAPEARFRFINYAEWATAEDWRAAHDEGFRQLAAPLQSAGITSTHGLYEVVHTGGAR